MDNIGACPIFHGETVAQVSWGGWTIEGQILIGKPTVRLRPLELLLMQKLIAAKGKVVTAEDFSDLTTWKTARFAVKRMRAVLGKDSIKTRRGHGSTSGYRLIRREKLTDHGKALLDALSQAVFHARKLIQQLENGDTNE